MPTVRTLSIEFLTPHPLVSPAYTLWASVSRERVSAAPAQVLKDGKTYLWFGGFAGLQSEQSGHIQGQVFRTLPSSFLDHAWLEAAAADGVQDYAEWYRMLQMLLPQEQKVKIFGPRGLTKSSAARFAGITRQTMHNALRRGS